MISPSHTSTHTSTHVHTHTYTYTHGQAFYSRHLRPQSPQSPKLCSHLSDAPTHPRLTIRVVVNLQVLHNNYVLWFRPGSSRVQRPARRHPSRTCADSTTAAEWPSPPVEHSCFPRVHDDAHILPAFRVPCTRPLVAVTTVISISIAYPHTVRSLPLSPQTRFLGYLTCPTAASAHRCRNPAQLHHRTTAASPRIPWCIPSACLRATRVGWPRAGSTSAWGAKGSWAAPSA